MKDKNVLLMQCHLKKDEIVDAASRLVKDSDFENKSGMVEVSYYLLAALNERLSEFQRLKMQTT